MPLDKQDLATIQRLVRDHVGKVPPRPVKAQTISTVTTDEVVLTSGDTVLSGNIQGIQQNQAVVWDGQKFVPSRASSIPLSTYSSVSSPPSSPQDGDLWYAASGLSDAPLWTFRYNASSASSYKWELVGGSEHVITITSYTGWNTSAWTAMNGVAYGFPRNGDYLIRGQWSFDAGGAYSYGAAIGTYQGVSYDVGAQSWMTTFGADYLTIVAPARVVTNTDGSSGAVALMYYAATAAPSAFFSGQISIQPVRII